MFWIILWIFQSFMNAFGMVLSKKVVENKAVWNNWQTFISRTNHVIFIIIILLIISIFSINIESMKFDLPENIISYTNIFLFVIATVWIYITYFLRRNAYANEKVSVLQPFAMLFQVFPVILGFIFIASERANLITFLVAIIASFIVILPNIDWKEFKMNKYSFMVLLSSTIKSGQLFVVLYFLTIVSPITFYFIESLFIIIISIIMILIKSEFNEVKKITKKYAKLLFSANLVVIFSILLVLTMYSSLGVVTTSLLSLLYLVFIYIFWYLLLKEIPSKKDVLIAIWVSICIVIWMLFKV